MVEMIVRVENGDLTRQSSLNCSLIFFREVEVLNDSLISPAVEFATPQMTPICRHLSILSKPNPVLFYFISRFPSIQTGV